MGLIVNNLDIGEIKQEGTVRNYTDRNIYNQAKKGRLFVTELTPTVTRTYALYLNLDGKGSITETSDSETVYDYFELNYIKKLLSKKVTIDNNEFIVSSIKIDDIFACFVEYTITVKSKEGL